MKQKQTNKEECLVEKAKRLCNCNNCKSRRSLEEAVKQMQISMLANKIIIDAFEKAGVFK